MAMFQSALAVRPRQLVGRQSPLTGSGSRSERIPWRFERNPVATVVQASGAIDGVTLTHSPIAPAATSRASAGSFPASRSGWMTFQSAASQPTKSTRLRGAAIAEKPLE